MDNIKHLQEKIGRNRKAMQEFYDNAAKDGRELLNKDEEKQFDALVEESNGLEKKLSFLIEQENAQAETAKTLEDAKPKQMSNDEYNEKYSKAFKKYVLEGMAELSKEEKDLMKGKVENIPAELKAQTISTTGGGYMIPQGFSNEVDKQLAAYGGIRSISRVLKTASGNNIPWPTIDDTSNVGRIEAVNGQVNTTDMVFGQKNLDAWIYSSDQLLIPWALSEDSSFNMDVFAGEILGERLARGTGYQYVLGSGSSAPQGIATAATEASGLPSGTGTLTANNLLDIKHSVDPAYRAIGGKWLFNDDTLKRIKKLQVASGDARPLWEPSMAKGEPSTIDGDAYAIDQNVASFGTAGNKFIYYGDFSKFIIREVGTPKAVVMRERYADYLQNGMFLYQRVDSELINNSAVVYGYFTAT